jgi:hypothetical protein
LLDRPLKTAFTPVFAGDARTMRGMRRTPTLPRINPPDGNRKGRLIDHRRCFLGGHQEDSMKRHLVAWAAGAAVLASSGAAFAHHSFAMFDSDQRVTVSGTVKDFQWTNPHAWIFLMAPGKDGQLVQWAIEMGGPGGLSREGWTQASLKPGMDVQVTIHPLRDGTNGGQFMAIKFPDGTQLGNPNRGQGRGPGGDNGPIL